ncbi:MAG: hypothetical protein PHH64_07645, partial [Proteiniphilum sp.]|nr:hypothetical protein [Proteiniphilum sp.]MDD4159265.1 hypothetical protein [Proteiniphilum sp.]
AVAVGHLGDQAYFRLVIDRDKCAFVVVEHTGLIVWFLFWAKVNKIIVSEMPAISCCRRVCCRKKRIKGERSC